MRKYLILALLFSCFSTLAWAQEINILSEQIPQQTPFAKPFDVRFEVGHTTGYVVEVDKESLPANFELIQEKTNTLSPATQAYDFTFIPFTLGVSTFTAVTFQLKESTGGKVLAEAQTEVKNITVQPVKFYDEKTLRDIRPPYIPASLFIWLLCALAAVILFLTIKHFYRTVKQDHMALKAQQDNRPADVIALSKIQLLLQSGLWEKKQYKLFYIELGEILKEYFWRRFSLDVSSDTSTELLRRAKTVPELTRMLMPLREYLSSSDLVKFAQVAPSADAMQKDVQAVQDLVRETTPKPIITKEKTHV